MAILNISAAFKGAGSIKARFNDKYFIGASLGAFGFVGDAYFVTPRFTNVFFNGIGRLSLAALYKTTEKLLTPPTLAGAGAFVADIYNSKRQPVVALFAGAGNLTARFAFRDTITGPILFRGWAEAVFRIADRKVQLTASFAGSGQIQPYSNVRHRMMLRQAWSATAALSARFGTRYNIAAALSASTTFQYYSIYILHPPVPGFFLDCELDGTGKVKLDIELVNSDKINPGINELAGSQVLWPQATGLEKAFADVDAYRLTRIYAELIIDQWDPYAISYRNLPYLAWAIGVNLWEDWWDEKFKRWWVAEQWTRKYERGSYLGLKNFTKAVGGELLRAVVPPAKTFPTKSLTADERQAYLLRFPQLRLYPYVGREQRRWNCFIGGHTFDPKGSGKFHRAKNGGYVQSSLQKMYPTAQTSGGRYQRTATLWDRGYETTLTVRKIAHVLMGPSAGWGFTPGTSQYDEEIVLPMTERVFFYLNQKKYLSAANKKYTVFTGKKAALRTITISRSGPLPFVQGQITYQTVYPTDQLMELLPEHVHQQHTTQKYRLFTAAKARFVRVQYPMRSEAWKYTYDRWFLFDPDRVPPLRRSGQAYLSHTRLGIDNYTAEALIRVRTKFQKSYVYCGGYCGKFRYLHKLNPEAILRLRRGVTASMALRDTVLINTKTTRAVEVRDIENPDGRFTIGQLVKN